MRSDFCIIGGGVSGLMTALLLERYLPTKKIVLIYSPKQKEIGVGESTNETWYQFCEAAQIEPADFFLHCDATPKICIKQKNWLRDNHEWPHFLSTTNDILTDPISQIKNKSLASLAPLNEPCHYYSKRLLYNIDPDSESNVFEKFGFTSQYTTELEFPTINDQKITSQANQFAILGQTFSVNFDNFKAIDFFRLVCKDRGIEIIEDTITNCEKDPNTGYISKVVGEKHTYISTFYFDCTGFKALLLGETLGSKPTSLADDFLVNRYTAFPTPLVNPPDPAIWVETTGKDDCWIWKVETSQRGGNGVLYSADFMTDEKLEGYIKEIGGDLNNLVAHGAKFSPMYREKIFYKNVLGVGIPATFFEPLQATTFGFVLRQLLLFVHVYNAWKNEPEATANYYNEIQLHNIKNIYYYLRTQYITQKNTPFWKTQREEAKYSFDLKEKLKVWRHRPPLYSSEINGSYGDINNALQFFRPGNFYQLLCGMEMIDHRSMLNYDDELFTFFANYHKHSELEIRERLQMFISQGSYDNKTYPTHIYNDGIITIMKNLEEYETNYLAKVSPHSSGWDHYVYIEDKTAFFLPIEMLFLPHELTHRYYSDPKNLPSIGETHFSFKGSRNQEYVKAVEPRQDGQVPFMPEPEKLKQTLE